MQACSALVCQFHSACRTFIASLGATQLRMQFYGQKLPVLCHKALLIGANYGFVFGVNGYDGGNLAEHAAQCVGIVYKHIAGACAEKGFHSAYATVIHALHFIEVAVGGAHIEAVVCPRHLCGALIFCLKGFESHRLWLGVGHIHKRGYAACHCCARFACNIGFMCQSGVAKMHLVVDCSGQNIVALHVHRLALLHHSGIGVALTHTMYLVAFYRHIAAITAPFVHYCSVMQ